MSLPRSILLAVSATAVTTAVHAVEVHEAWIDRLDGAAGMDDYGEAIAAGADGSTYVAGLVFEQVSENLFAPRFMTIRYDADGNRLWTRTYAGTFASGAAAAHHIAIDPAGDIVVSGSTNQGEDWAAVKYDPAGNELWRSVYQANSTYLTEPEAMAIDGDGNIFLAGTVGDLIDPDAGVLVKLAPDGAQTWAKRYYGPTLDGASFVDLAVDAAGNAYASGTIPVSGLASEACVVKYDPAGNHQWTYTDGYPGQTSHDWFTSIVIDGDGNAVAAGSFGNNTTIGPDIAITKIDVAGAATWTQFYMSPQQRTDVPTGVAVDSENSVVVIGYAETADPNDYAALTLKYDASGVLQWEQRVAGDEFHFDRARSVAIDDANNVYVCGTYDPIGGSRYFTVRYEPDGAETWFMSYAGPMGGGSRAAAIAVGPDHSVSVTGSSPGAASEFDITTIRYEQTGISGPGDVNGDGVVNFADLVEILGAWGPCEGCPADLDGDGFVTFADVLIVLANWS